MRRLYFLMLCILSFSGVTAQEELSKEEKQRRQNNIDAANPFKQFGYNAKVATLSKGKYLEVHDLDSIVTIGSVRFHVEKMKIVGVVVPDSTDREFARPIGDIASRWLSPDPLAEEYPDWTPYRFGFNNPIRYNDPTGLLEEDWIPGVDDNGAVTYTAEKGDSAKTLSSQYGITQENAEQITGTTGSQTIKEGTQVTGEEVKQVTGSEVLKLDLDSKEGKSQQRRFDHFMFASDHSKTQGSWGFLTTDYFSNTQYKTTLDGKANFRMGGESFAINYSIPFYRSATFDGSGTGVFISNSVFNINNTDGRLFPNNQANIRSSIHHPKTANQMGTFEFYVHRNNANAAYSRFNKKFPRYMTSKLPKKID